MKVPRVIQNSAFIQGSAGAIGGLALLLTLATAGVGVRVQAQSASAAQAAPQSASPPSASTPPQAPGSAQTAATPNASPAPAAESASTPSANVATENVANGRKQQINGQCADLLKLANALKSAVDKTTMDELSIAVVRQADQIEQLARKMKGEIKSTAEK